MQGNDAQATHDIGWKFVNSYTQLPDMFFKRVHPTRVKSSKMVLLNERLANDLGVSVAGLNSVHGISELSGNRIPGGADPIAEAYAGHQFGHFTMLGDGRAILLGEHITPRGERLDIQLKGSGRTPYSRSGDGRAALGPMLREYLISEAMYGLHIPTTRSLAVVTTGEPVFREERLMGAVMTRVASSHLRVGTFEYAARWGTLEDLQTLADYALERHFSDAEITSNRYHTLLEEVIKRQALLIAKWQLVGFVHGVMNTDNMAISGETIDYGPCAFMDTYNPKTVFSSIDHAGRYAYGNQPAIGAWNLSRFAESLLPLLHENEETAVRLAEKSIMRFDALYRQHWLDGMRKKLGMFNDEPEDMFLIEQLLDLMRIHKADYTNTFLGLTFGSPFSPSLFDTSDFAQWHQKWQDRLSRQDQDTVDTNKLMHSSNPGVIPRNYRVEDAIQAATQGDLSLLERLLNVLAKPYEHSVEQLDYTLPPAETNQPYRTFCGT